MRPRRARRPDEGLEAEEPHPLTKDWATRIKNPKVRAAFVKRPLDGTRRARPARLDGHVEHERETPPGRWTSRAWLDVASSPDLVVVGFQEIVPLTPGKVLMQEDAQPRASGRPSSSGA